MRGVSVYDVAMNLGTSVHYIEKTYARQLTAMMKQKELTKGQGYWKAIEEREEGILATSKGDKEEIFNNARDAGITDNEIVVLSILEKIKKGGSTTQFEVYAIEHSLIETKEGKEKVYIHRTKKDDWNQLTKAQQDGWIENHMQTMEELMNEKDFREQEFSLYTTIDSNQ